MNNLKMRTWKRNYKPGLEKIQRLRRESVYFEVKCNTSNRKRFEDPNFYKKMLNNQRRLAKKRKGKHLTDRQKEHLRRIQKLSWKRNKKFRMEAISKGTKKLSKSLRKFWRDNKNSKRIKEMFKARARRFKMIETKPEKILYKFLRENKIKFTKQKVIKMGEPRYTIVDAYLRDYNICLFTDGTYWHSFRKRKDKEINQRLKDLGFKVFRIDQTKDFRVEAKKLLKFVGRN